MFFVLKFELILIIGSNNVLTKGARKVYRGRRVGQGWFRLIDSGKVVSRTLLPRNIIFLIFPVLSSVMMVIMLTEDEGRVHEEHPVDAARGSVGNDEARVGKLEEDVLRVLPAGAHGDQACCRGNAKRALSLVQNSRHFGFISICA
jgi:hypothetical protein